ncbi:hypothetical protein ACP275_10G105900 [Erythranthe tilingii]
MSSGSSNGINSRGRSSRSFTTDSPNQALFCQCGLPMAVQTSRTAANPGRRFISCPQKIRALKCDFFRWCDEDICYSCKKIMSDSFQKINHLEALLDIEQSRAKNWRIIAVGCSTVVVLIALVICIL